jgi:hypothetical protein
VDAASAIFVREVVEPALAQPEGAERLRSYCDNWVGYLERKVFSGGCFFSAASVEFDGRPGPVRDKLRANQEAWFAELAKHAELGGVDDPKQTVFEVYCLIHGANSHHQLLDDEEAFARARRAMARLLPG